MRPIRERIAEIIGVDYLDVPVLLISDGHESRMDVDVLEALAKQGILLLIYPPNCTPILQQLDFKLFGLYKQYLRTEVSVSNSANFAETIAMHDLSALTFEPWTKIATPVRILSSFSGTGVFPLNPRLPLDRMVTSPSALVYDVNAAIESLSTPTKEVAAPPPPPAQTLKRPPPIGDLREKYPDGKSFKMARLSYDDIKYDRNLWGQFEYFTAANWAVISPHFQNAMAHQIDNIPDVPMFDAPEISPPFRYHLMGSHIEDILQIPRPPTFGKKKKSRLANIDPLDSMDEESADDATRVKPFGVMTSPQIITAKKEIREKKLQEAREKEEKASEKEEGRLARQAVSREKDLKKNAVLLMEAPIRDRLRAENIINNEEYIEISKLPLGKAHLLALAERIGLRVPKSAKKELIVSLLLDDGFG